MDFGKIYKEPDSFDLARVFLNRLWRKLHVYNFSLLILYYGKHRCLTAGNKVLIADGSWKNIEDIKIGDDVLSPQKDGSVIISKVMQTTNYFCNDVYDVIEAKGKKKLLYSCSDNHNIPLLAYCSRRKDPLPRDVFKNIKECTAKDISNFEITYNTIKLIKNYEPCNISIRCIPARPQMVYGFTLDSESHWFITNNWIVTCNSGKSLTAVSLAHILDSTFDDNMEDRIVYSSKAFLSAMREIRRQRIKGGAVIFDEAGSSELASQRWYEDTAKVISSNLQACGYLNPFIGFVTQNFSFVNTQARKLSQGVFEVDRVTNQCSRIKPFWIENNPWTSKFYRRYPIFCEKRNGIPSNVYKLGMIKIGLPPKDIMDRYIAHSQAFKDKLLDDSARDIDILDTQKQMQNAYVTDLNDIVELVKKDLETYKTSSRHERLDEDLIRHKFKLKHRDAKVVKILAEKSIKASSRQAHTQKDNVPI